MPSVHGRSINGYALHQHTVRIIKTPNVNCVKQDLVSLLKITASGYGLAAAVDIHVHCIRPHSLD